MSTVSINTASGVEGHEIDKLLFDFHRSVEGVSCGQKKYQEMLVGLSKFNPNFVPVDIKTDSGKAKVLAQVVAGIYAPFIHGFTSTLVKNIKLGKLSPNVIAPPRDAIPIAVSLKEQAILAGVEVNICMPYLNRNILGIANNQKDTLPSPDPLLDLYFNQIRKSFNGDGAITEAETGIYGTTSLIMAEEFKKRGINYYTPVKLYGLGPNISWIHGVLTEGKVWVADTASSIHGIDDFMVILDTMEELGMQNAHKSPEKLHLKNGSVEPVVEYNLGEDVEIARVTNMAVINTAGVYQNLDPSQYVELVTNIESLVEASNSGMPFTLKSSIPPMDSKEEHFAKIRSSGLFDYSNLSL